MHYYQVFLFDSVWSTPHKGKPQQNVVIHTPCVATTVFNYNPTCLFLHLSTNTARAASRRSPHNPCAAARSGRTVPSHPLT